MTDDFATVMRRALDATRSGDPHGATKILRSAMSGRTDTGAEMGPGTGSDTGCGPCDRISAAFARTRGRMRRPGTSPGGAKRAPIPDGAHVEARSIAGRDVRLFAPSPREGGPKGLVLMLHGCTQSPEDFALGTGMDRAAEAAGYAVAYPAQTGSHNMQSCWNWFRPQDQGASGGEPATLATIAGDLGRELGTNGRVYAAGLSAGGAMAAILAETHPEVFSAVGIHSGLPAGAAGDMPSAFAAMQGNRTGRPVPIPAIVFHGTADTTVSPKNARTLLPGNGVETRHHDDGRAWTRLTTDAGSELWLIEGAGHAWSGGDAAGSYADPAGPDASTEMLRFFDEASARR